jgi:hypothetical protein
MKFLLKIVASSSLALLLGACAGSQEKAAESAPPFSGPDDVAYAAKLWKALDDSRLVGSGRIVTSSYTGVHPHGAILQTVESTLSVDGQRGAVLVKHNFGGEGVSKEKVSADYDAWIDAVTVMYQRDGYDPDNNDWFWAKYLPDGSLDKNPKGMQLAGRVAKGNTEAGCIACHAGAPGGDLVFTNDRYAKN